MYKLLSDNGAKHVARDLLKLCNENFIEPYFQPYAGANFECLYCGAIKQRDGSVDHSVADCPVMKFRDIIEKNINWIEEVN